MDSYPGKRIENISDKIDESVVNSYEETVFVNQVGTKNVIKGRSKEVYEKYKAMIRKIKDNCRWSVVCFLILRYDVGPIVLSKVLGINARLEKLCSREDVQMLCTLMCGIISATIGACLAEMASSK